MDLWHILAAGCLCAMGALTFLKIVADELIGMSSELDALRRREEARGAEELLGPPIDSVVVESVVEKLT